jgi:transposase
MAKLCPATPAQQMRFDLALELLDDVRRLDGQLKESHRRIRVAIKASRTSLPEIYGVGPIVAATVIGYSGDVTRFANRYTYASYNGTAPIEFSSGTDCASSVYSGQPQAQPRFAHGAITQIRNPGVEGRIYFERMVAEGKTKKEALRSLKRHISNAVYRQLILDAH